MTKSGDVDFGRRSMVFGLWFLVFGSAFRVSSCEFVDLYFLGIEDPRIYTK